MLGLLPPGSRDQRTGAIGTNGKLIENKHLTHACRVYAFTEGLDVIMVLSAGVRQAAVDLSCISYRPDGVNELVTRKVCR